MLIYCFFYFKNYFICSVIFVTEAFFSPTYDCPTNQIAKIKPNVLLGLFKVVYSVKLLIG